MSCTEEDLIYSNWLMHADGIGKSTIFQLLEQYGSPKGIYEIPDKDVDLIFKPKQAEWFKLAKKEIDPDICYRKLEQKGINIFPEMHDLFPEKLRMIPNRPFAIYVLGKLPDPDIPAVSIIGARMCSEYGRFIAREFGSRLAASGIQIISGMASGVDGISQRGAIAAGGKSYGVVGCGADICYPDENRDLYEDLKKNGGIISEYKPGTQPEARLFPLRNRIISGLSDAVIVVEAKKKSGTAITVNMALEQGKDVFAVPGRTTDRLSDGCNNMIKEGAFIATCAEDVIEFFGLGSLNGTSSSNSSNSPKAAKPSLKLNATETLIIQIIDMNKMSISEIHQRMEESGKAMAVPEVMQIIIDLCAKGVLIQEGGFFRKRF